jgi:GNAT superfamily N-acetyltransferase
MQQRLKELLKQLEQKYPKGSSTCSKSHLKMALYDWNKEKAWDNKNCFVHDLDGKGYIFYSFTTREPKHCTIRHLFVLEECRKQGIGKKLIDLIKTHMKMRSIKRFRFFCNKPAVEFYTKLGFKYLGESKQGLPFVYCDRDTLKPVQDKKQLAKLYRVY